MKHALPPLAAALLVATAPLAQPADPAGPDPAQEYYVVSAPLRELLHRVARDSDLNIEVDSVDRVFVTSTFLSGTGQQILDQLAATYDLSRFEFNGKVHLAPRAEQQSRILRSEDYTFDEMLAAIEDSGLDLSPFAVTPIANPNAFIVTAPPRLIAIAETVVDSLPRKGANPGTQGIIVRHGVEIVRPQSE